MENNYLSCCNCRHFSENNSCTNNNGKLYGIILTNSLAEAEHDCSSYEEATYQITPKGYLWSALYEMGIELDQNIFDEVWQLFEEGMENGGYIKH